MIRKHILQRYVFALTDRSGLLADVATAINKSGSNIINAHTETSEYGTVRSYFTISVESTEQLSKIMNTLRKVKHVKDVKRIISMD